LIGRSLALVFAVARADGPSAGDAAPPVSPDVALALVHVEANVGSASGGHSALRIGERVFHYHHSDDGLLTLERDPWATFCHLYAGLENRSLHVVELAAAPADVARIAGRFNRAFIVQARDLDRLRRLGDDAAWWLALGDGATARPLPLLRGAGLLAATGRDDVAAVALRDAVGGALGPSFLKDAIAQVDAGLRAFRPARDATDLEPLRERLLLRAALLALEEARPLAADAVVDDVDLAPLTAVERSALESFRARHAATVVDLLRSQRPDRGFPLHVAIARHHAAALSLACDRLVTLDVVPDDARCVARDDPSESAAAARVAARALDECREIRAAVCAEPRFREPLFALLEESLTRCREAQRGARGGPLRLFEGRAVPSKGRAVARDGLAPVPEATGRAARAAARRDDFDRTLRARYAYALIGRNCATELVRTLDESFVDERDATAALGARLEPGAGLTFIPFELEREVAARLRVANVLTIPSHRLREMARLERNDPGIATSLREATTLTSTIYTPREADGAFLFFTDDAAWLRPVAGVANLGYGVARGVGGLFTWPFDDGAALRAGWSGALFSLPELVFCNVRKGTFRDVEPEESRKP